jgi:hypothetical protein
LPPDRLDASTDEEVQLAGAGGDPEEATTPSTCTKCKTGAAFECHPMIAGMEHGAPFHQSFEPQQQ